MKLKGQVIVVTGASAGMGRAMVEAMVREGANVVVVARRPDLLEELQEELQEAPGKVEIYPGDCTRKEVNEGMIDFAVEKFGHLDTLVNNAGIMDDNTAIGDMSDEMMMKVFQLNTFGVMYAMRYAVKQFLKQSGGEPAYEEIFGRIVNVCSIGARHFTAGAAYCASKAAILQVTKHTAFMYLKEGIKCNLISPGGILTDIALTMPPSDPFGKARTGVFNPLSPGLGMPEQIASVAVFLCSEDSSYVNGQEITVDGGWLNL